jgi:hypothetical protein
MAVIIESVMTIVRLRSQVAEPLKTVAWVRTVRCGACAAMGDATAVRTRRVRRMNMNGILGSAAS